MYIEPHINIIGPTINQTTLESPQELIGRQ